MDYMLILICGLLFVMGSSFFVVSLTILIRKKMRMKNWTKTTGLVVDVDSKLGMLQPIGTTRNTLYKPKVRFQTADGSVIDYEPAISSSWNNYQTGEQIEVFYSPQNPANVMFGTRTIDWIRLSFFTVFGGLMALFSIFFFLINSAFPKF